MFKKLSHKANKCGELEGRSSGMVFSAWTISDALFFQRLLGQKHPPPPYATWFSSICVEAEFGVI